MSRRSRLLRRLLLGGGALAVVALAAALLADRRAPLELLPDGAAVALELSGAGEVLERLEDTRFAAAFISGATYTWLEGSATVRAIDQLRAGIGRATSFTPRRRHLLDLVGREAAAAWYPAPGAGAAPPSAARWIVAGKLGWRALPLAAAARVALRLGLGGDIPREEVSGATFVSLGTGEGALHLFLDGRLLVAANDPGLIRGAARLAAGDGVALRDTMAWKQVFAALPARGELRLWARGHAIPPGALPGSRVPIRGAGAVLSARTTVTIDAFIDAPDRTPRRRDGAGAPPALALDGPVPLLFHSAAGAVPRVIADMLGDRAATVARRGALPAPPPPALESGFACAVTALEDGGLFPRPQGIIAIGMRDADAARRALGQLFPPAARSSAGRWGLMLSTRESLPLAGEFELWGAAGGDRLVLATQRALIEGLAAKADSRSGSGATDAAADDWVPDSVTTLNVTKLLPALRRYAPPLAGLLRARNPGAPDVSRDLELLAAVRAIAATTGSSGAGTLLHITLDVGDLPAAR